MKTVSDLEHIKTKLLHIFPDAIRGSVAKSRWGNGRKQLHLSYWIAADTVGGYMIQAKGDLFYFVDWDSNKGRQYYFAESDKDLIVERILKIFDAPMNIDRTVCG